MRKTTLILLLLCALSAMAQKVGEFNPNGPKVKEMIYTDDKGKQTLYRYDSTDQSIYKTQKYSRIVPFKEELLRIDTVTKYFHRTGIRGEVTFDSIFCVHYKRKYQHFDDQEDWDAMVYDTTYLHQLSLINSEGDTMRQYCYNRNGNISYSWLYTYDINHHLARYAGYRYSIDGAVDESRFYACDKRGNVIRMDSYDADGTWLYAESKKYDKHDNCIKLKSVRRFCGRRDVFDRFRIKYRYDKHGNWISCSYGNTHHPFAKRKIIYWE